MTLVRKAVIPAAGHGTRMRPVSRVVPKELLPVGTKPAIQFALEEVASAGLEEVAVVVSSRKQLVRDYVDELVERGELALKVRYVLQDVQRGLGDAISLCADFLGGEPFALLLPDNVFLSPEYDFGRMVGLFLEYGRDVVGVLEVGEEASGRFGNCGRIDFAEMGPGALEIMKLHGKSPGTLQIAPGERVTRTCGRYICLPDLLRHLEELRPLTPGELDEVPAYQRVIAERGAVGCVLPGPLFDVGNPAGFLAANAFLHDSSRS